MRQQPWYPWASAAGWGLLVFALVFVNTGGNLLLAAGIGAVVAEISRRVALARADSGGAGPPQQ